VAALTVFIDSTIVMFSFINHVMVLTYVVCICNELRLVYQSPRGSPHFALITSSHLSLLDLSLQVCNPSVLQILSSVVSIGFVWHVFADCRLRLEGLTGHLCFSCSFFIPDLFVVGYICLTINFSPCYPTYTLSTLHHLISSKTYAHCPAFGRDNVTTS